MNKQSARASKFSTSSTKLPRAKAKGSIESIKMSNFKCFDHSTDDFGYLSARREWSRSFPSEVQPSNHEGPEAEQSQNGQSSTSTIIDFEQGKIADSRPSKQSEKTPKNKKSPLFKIFNRRSLSKKQHDESNHPNAPDLDEQESSKKKSPTTTHVTISYAPVAQLALSTECCCAALQTSSTASYDEPPDLSLQAKQYRLLCRLHSTLNEATAIAEKFLILYKRDD